MTTQNIYPENIKATIPLKEVRETCDDIADNVSAYKNTHSIIFTLSGIQANESALLEKQNEILSQPEGQELYNNLKHHLEIPNAPSKLIGITALEQKTMMGFKSKTHFTALININAENYSELSALKTDLYKFIWKFFAVAEDIKNQNSDMLTSQNNVFNSKWNENLTALGNMLADAFAGSVMEIKGHNGTLRNIAKQHCLSCFENLKTYNAKANPFPILLETIQMVYDDICQSLPSNPNDSEILKIAFDIIHETKESLDENLVRQWHSFIIPAQEMAWAETSIAQILGAAIYTSDNVYNRATAHMVSAILNSDPMPIIQFNGYNAFSDIENQQRSHKLACFETFEFIQSRQFDKQNPVSYFKTAQLQCEILLNGKPNGWCAPALVSLGVHITKTPDISKEHIEQIFKMEINTIRWDSIRNMHKELISFKEQNKEIDMNSIIEILRQEEETRDAAINIKTLIDMKSYNKP